ncbi:MAG: TlpA family protein disulfide reductase [Gemmatimonadetes bacterium]|nr:TlpA family protein disulfide reductase [Gemmatimonadota bacterium]
MTQPDASSPMPAAPPRAGRARGPSRLPYALGVIGLALLVGAAWLGRNRFDPVIAGLPAPGFLVSTLDGQPVTLDSYRGKVVLLNVWATWCAPCREEMPSMQRLYEQMAGKDFEILAVSVDEAVDGKVPKEALAAFAAELGLTFPMLHSPPESPDDIQRVYQTTGVPESFLIGKDGVIYRRLSGATSWDSPQYQEQILRLLGE